MLSNTVTTTVPPIEVHKTLPGGAAIAGPSSLVFSPTKGETSLIRKRIQDPQRCASCGTEYNSKKDKVMNSQWIG